MSDDEIDRFMANISDTVSGRAAKTIIESLRAKVAELERDAARYRWLREHSTQPIEPWSTHNNPESLDAAIDQQLQQEKV